jgi:hypothetical protein
VAYGMCLILISCFPSVHGSVVTSSLFPCGTLDLYRQYFVLLYFLYECDYDVLFLHLWYYGTILAFLFHLSTQYLYKSCVALLSVKVVFSLCI